MSEGKAVVRSAGNRRALDDWLVVRFPVLYRFVAAAVTRLPPRSRLRRALLWRWTSRTFEAYNRRDVELLVCGSTEDVEILTFTEGRAENRPFRGHEGIREWLRSDAEAWEEISVEAHDIRDLGDRVLVIGRITGRGRGSGVSLDSSAAWLFELRSGMVSHMQSYLEPHEAFEAIGVRQQPGPASASKARAPGSG